MNSEIKKAADILLRSKKTTVFTGAGISVESGIPPFRGKGGLWEKYDPTFIDITYFHTHTKASWEKIVEVFYEGILKAEPNSAHKALAKLEKANLVSSVITQNIDALHQNAGSQTVYEYHGTTRTISCTKCGAVYNAPEISFETLPPLCEKCGGILKPDFVFFGEQIDQTVMSASQYQAESCTVMLVIGTTGEIMPACMLPHTAKMNNSYIIEINPERSAYSDSISDIYIQEPASIALNQILVEMNLT
jgi:NAD-dependent deacetylase